MYRREFLKGASLALAVASLPVLASLPSAPDLLRPGLIASEGNAEALLLGYHVANNGNKAAYFQIHYWDVANQPRVFLNITVGRNSFESYHPPLYGTYVLPTGYGVAWGHDLDWVLTLKDERGIFFHSFHNGVLRTDNAHKPR